MPLRRSAFTMTNPPTLKELSDQVRDARRVPTVSAVLRDGRLIEMVYDPEKEATALIVWRAGEWSREASILLDDRRCLVPYSPHNNRLEDVRRF